MLLGEWPWCVAVVRIYSHEPRAPDWFGVSQSRENYLRSKSNFLPITCHRRYTHEPVKVYRALQAVGHIVSLWLIVCGVEIASGHQQLQDSNTLPMTFRGNP